MVTVFVGGVAGVNAIFVTMPPATAKDATIIFVAVFTLRRSYSFPSRCCAIVKVKFLGGGVIDS